jgi:RNA polymerase sigma-70 factor (ECF subfamily)
MIMSIEELYNKHQQELKRFANALAHSEKEAEDLLQETFLRALGNSEKLLGLQHYEQRAWLYKVLRNIHRDRQRKKRFETTYDEAIEPSADVDRTQSIEMRELMDALPPKYYDLIYKRYWHGLNSRQIAELLEIPDSTVRYQLQQALKLLRTQYNRT